MSDPTAPHEISDAIVEKARLICAYLRDTEEPPLRQVERVAHDIAAALEAAAPSLRAQGMREAVSIVKSPDVAQDLHWLDELKLSNAILARADAIEKGEG